MDLGALASIPQIAGESQDTSKCSKMEGWQSYRGEFLRILAIIARTLSLSICKQSSWKKWRCTVQQSSRMTEHCSSIRSLWAQLTQKQLVRACWVGSMTPYRATASRFQTMTKSTQKWLDVDSLKNCLSRHILRRKGRVLTICSPLSRKLRIHIVLRRRFRSSGAFSVDNNRGTRLRP